MPAALFVLLILLSFMMIRPFLMAIFLGALLSYIFYPVYKRGKDKLKSKTLMAFLICLVILILVIVPTFFFLKALVNESYSLYVLGKQKLSVGFFQECHNPFCDQLKGLREDPEIKYYFQEGLKGLTNWVIKKISSFLISIPNILLNLFIMFFTLFYFLRDGDSFVRKVSDYLSMQKKRYVEILKRLKEIIYAVVYGYIIVALIQGALGALGFFLFGVSSPLFWGVVMAFLALIPYLGTGLIWGPAALVIFLNGIFQDSSLLIYKGIGLFVYGFILVGSLDNFIKPRIIGNRAKVHPSLILLGIFGGIFLLGPLGVIAGPLVLSLTAIVVEEYLSKKKAD